MEQQDDVLTVSPSRSVTSFTLKALAIVCMTADHVSIVFSGVLPFGWQCALQAVGGVTFPIMAFLLTEGYRYTSDIRRYAFRLGIFALVAEIPYGFFLWGGSGAYGAGDVLFTLLIGLVLLYLYDHLDNRPVFWSLFLAGLCISYVCDWGVIGPIVILLFHILKGPRQRIFVPIVLLVVGLGIPEFMAVLGGDLSALPSALYALVGCSLAGVFLLGYRGQRGHSMKWFFYAYYPLHIAVIGLVFAALSR